METKEKQNKIEILRNNNLPKYLEENFVFANNYFIRTHEREVIGVEFLTVAKYSRL